MTMLPLPRIAVPGPAGRHGLRSWWLALLPCLSACVGGRDTIPAASYAGVYRGELRTTSVNGKACYPDMVGTSAVELVVRDAGPAADGYLIVTPRYAYAFTQSEADGALTFVRSEVHAPDSPFFVPRSAAGFVKGARVRLRFEWHPLLDCTPVTQDVELSRVPDDSQRALDL